MINNKINNKLTSLNDNSVWLFTKQSMVFDEVFNATKLLKNMNKKYNIEQYFKDNYKMYGLSTNRHRILIIAQLFGLLTKNKYYSAGQRYNDETTTEIFDMISKYPVGSNEYNIIKTEQILKIKVKAIINVKNQNEDYNLLPIIFSYAVLKKLKDKFAINSISIDKFFTYIMTSANYSDIDNVLMFLKESSDTEVYKNIKSYKENSRFLTILRNNINLFNIGTDIIEINPIFEEYFSQTFLEKCNILSLHKQIKNDAYYKKFLTTYQNFNINLIDPPIMNQYINNIDSYDYMEDSVYIAMVDQQKEYNIDSLQDAFKNKPVIIENLLKKYDRNPVIGKIAIIKSGYKCINDDMHTTFISKTTNKQFMEAHHLIPINFQTYFWDNFNINIDCVENIVSLCPNCHRAIHHSIDDYKRQILENVYNKKMQEFKKIGINITFEKLLKYYNL